MTMQGQRNIRKKYEIIRPSTSVKKTGDIDQSNRVYIGVEFETFHFEEIAFFENCLFLGCKIKSMKVLNKYDLEEYPSFRKCLFYNCFIDSMEIKGIKHAEEIYFINCKAKKLEIENVYALRVSFIGCEIKDSKFKSTILPAFEFSDFKKKTKLIFKNFINDRIEDAKAARKEIKKYIKKSLSRYKSLLNQSEFLFCELNDTHIEDTEITETAIKHCQLENLEIFQNVVMKDVDLRGTKIFNKDLGPIQFQNILFSKSFFLIEIIFYILSIPFRVNKCKNFIKEKLRRKSGRKIFFITPTAKERIDIAAWKKSTKFKRWGKKLMYKNCFTRFLANTFSSTEIKHISYEKADFSTDYHLFWYIQHLDYVEDFKKSHPIIAFISFITTNYMRSITGLAVWSIIGILLFSLLYSCCGRFDVYPQKTGKDCPILNPVDDQGHPLEPIYLSFKIFVNNDLYPMEARDRRTKNIMICEVIFGYLVIGVLVGILVNFISQQASNPKKTLTNKSPPGGD